MILTTKYIQNDTRQNFRNMVTDKGVVPKIIATQKSMERRMLGISLKDLVPDIHIGTGVATLKWIRADHTLLEHKMIDGFQSRISGWLVETQNGPLKCRQVERGGELHV